MVILVQNQAALLHPTYLEKFLVGSQKRLGKIWEECLQDLLEQTKLEGHWGDLFLLLAI